MIRRFSVILIPTLLTLFVLEIFFVSYLPDANLRGSWHRFSSTTSSVDVFSQEQFPNDRRETAPEIRKYTQNFMRSLYISLSDATVRFP